MTERKAKRRNVRRAGVAALAMLICISGVAMAADAPRGPHISVAEPLHDFGAAVAGTVLEHVFVVRNTGDAVLEIRKVAPS